MKFNAKKTYELMIENEGAMSSGPLVSEPAHTSVMTPPGAKEKKKKKKKCGVERQDVLDEAVFSGPANLFFVHKVVRLRDEPLYKIDYSDLIKDARDSDHENAKQYLKYIEKLQKLKDETVDIYDKLEKVDRKYFIKKR